MRIVLTAIAVFVFVSPCAHAQSQSNKDPTTTSQASDPCARDVSKFEQTIGFVRQNQGNQAAAELKEKLLPAKVEHDLLFSGGYCALAKYLREKKLVE